MTQEPVLALDRLRVWYGTATAPVRAVDGVSLDIAPGEAVGLVGESGCGKSTLGRAVLAMTTSGGAIAGAVRYQGRNILGLSSGELRRLRGPEIGLIFQEPMTRLNPLLRIDEHFRETLQTHEPTLSERDIRHRALQTLGDVGIPPTRFHQYPHEFSGGMRQRIMIALALVLRPKLLVADEPTTSLDVLVEAQILRLLTDLRRTYGTALLMITHNLGIVAQTCDRMAVMYAGRVAEDGAVSRVFAEPAHPYTRALLRSTISLATAELHHIPGAPPNLARPPDGCRFHPRCPQAMQVCARQEPVEVRPAADQRTACWLHGPRAQISAGGEAPLAHEEVSVAEEA